MTREVRLKFAFEAFIFVMMIFAIVVNLRSGWKFYSSLMPMIFSVFGATMSGIVLLREIYRYRKLQTTNPGVNAETQEAPFFDLLPLTLRFFGWIVLFYIGVKLIGFMATMVLAIVSYMRLMGQTSWLVSLLSAGFVVLSCYGVYETLLHIVWPEPLILRLFK